ncbi:hypothetical protein AB1Y20_006037 [Prymnesium parvum]|uniref:Nucleotide-diphospho-sugar transferase domain-containing protein n=1 Tax=Prymnesium parvum TaxID=97485 RepID=A0AB34J3G7_PRYPA
MSSGCSLTCRGVHFSRIEGGAAAMACRQVVPLEVSRRSYVYYWRNRTKPSVFQYEGVCRKRHGTHWHVLTFGSHAEHKFKAREYVCRPSRTIGADTCLAANLTDVERASSRRWMEKHGVNLTNRGVGYWKWKPLLILSALRRLPRGDVLLWMDRDLRLFNRPLNMLFCIGQNVRKGVAGFHFPCFVERKWTKRELAEAMGADHAMMETVQLYAGLLVLRKNKFALSFVEEWLWWMTARNGSYSSDQYNPARQSKGFREHRHDQSILSLLAKSKGVKTFPIPSASHDPGDMWGWEAGFCNRTMAMPLPRASVNYHYRIASDYARTKRECERVQKSDSAPLVDYVTSNRNDTGKYIEAANTYS